MIRSLFLINLINKLKNLFLLKLIYTTYIPNIQKNVLILFNSNSILINEEKI